MHYLRKRITIVFSFAFIVIVLLPLNAKASINYIMNDVIEDANWSDEGLIYQLTEDIQIKQESTLTIGPGVKVEGNGHSIIVYGSLDIISSSLTDTTVLIGNNDISSAASIMIKNSNLTGGELLSPTGNSGYAHIELRNNQFTDLEEYTYIWYPIDDTYITGNKFNNCGCLSIGSNHDVYIYNNEFHGHSGPDYEEAVIFDWVQYNNSHCYVRYNKFDYTGTVLKLGSSPASIIADHNYWYTNREELISSRIYDYNDDFECAGIVEYSPILTIEQIGKTITFPFGMQLIEKEAFANSGCMMVFVPESCLVIEENAFSNCVNLAYIEVPWSCVIEEGAFSGNTSVIISRY